MNTLEANLEGALERFRSDLARRDTDFEKLRTDMAKRDNRNLFAVLSLIGLGIALARFGWPF